MTASELKYRVEQAGHEPHFFTRSTMRFFGDTMRNYGVRKAEIVVMPGDTVKCWELYRRRPVKNGLNSSSYFDQADYKRIFPRR